MFEINNAIGQWKQELRNSHTMKDSDIQELQSHLEEEMENLQIKGLSKKTITIIKTGIGIIMLYVLNFSHTIILARYNTAEEIGDIFMGHAYCNAATRLLYPIALIIFAILLLPKRPRQTA